MPDTITPSVLPAPRDPDGPYTVSVVCTGRAGVSRGEPMGAAAIEADAATHVPT